MILKAQSLKSNPMLWVGVAALVYGAFLMLGGPSLKAVAAVAVGAYLVLQKVSPLLAGKVKAWLVNKVRDLLTNVVDNPIATTTNVIASEPSVSRSVNTTAMEARPSTFATVSGEAVLGETVPVEHRDFFKPAEHDALTYLAMEAKKAGDDSAVEQLRAVNDKFFTISVNRIKTEEKDDEKPAV